MDYLALAKQIVDLGFLPAIIIAFLFLVKYTLDREKLHRDEIREKDTLIAIKDAEKTATMKEFLIASQNSTGAMNNTATAMLEIKHSIDTGNSMTSRMVENLDYLLRNRK